MKPDGIFTFTHLGTASLEPLQAQHDGEACEVLECDDDLANVRFPDGAEVYVWQDELTPMPPVAQEKPAEASRSVSQRAEAPLAQIQSEKAVWPSYVRQAVALMVAVMVALWLAHHL